MEDNETLAQKLFDGLKAGGAAEIARFVCERIPESTSLDYKLARANPAGLERSKREDLETLSKACCGFANTEGGVIIWGVDARAPAPDEADLPQSAGGVPQFAEFMTWLEREAAVCVFPPVRGIRHHAIPLENDTGFAVTLVPAGSAIPYRRNLPDSKGYHFIIRAGSSFIQAPMPLVAGMFGRRPRPQLELKLMYDNARYEQEKQVVFAILPTLFSVGSIPAKGVHLTLRVDQEPGPNSKIQFARHRDQGWILGNNVDNTLSLYGAGNGIAPVAFERPVAAYCRLKPPFKQGFSVKVTWGCEESVWQSLSYGATADQLAEWYPLACSAIEDPMIDWTRQCEIAKQLFGESLFKAIPQP
jgi:hypothetical protein